MHAASQCGFAERGDFVRRNARGVSYGRMCVSQKVERRRGFGLDRRTHGQTDGGREGRTDRHTQSRQPELLATMPLAALSREHLRLIVEYVVDDFNATWGVVLVCCELHKVDYLADVYIMELILD